MQRVKLKNPGALRHGGYCANAVLPGEDRAEFEKLHRDLISELSPDGALEHRTVAEIARIVWRKENIGTFRRAELVRERFRKMTEWKRLDIDIPDKEGSFAQFKAEWNAAREKLGDDAVLLDAGSELELKRFIEDWDIEDRLDGKIDRCLKRLLFLRGLKSVTSSTSTPQRRLAGASEAA
jgi:hypothetical protein